LSPISRVGVPPTNCSLPYSQFLVRGKKVGGVTVAGYLSELDSQGPQRVATCSGFRNRG
jgi:hypothetical protein